MDQNKIVVGLDIGTTKISVIVGRKNEFGKLEILGMGKSVSDGVIRGMVTNIDKTVNAINKALRDAEEQSNISIGEVNVGIAGQHIKSAMYSGSIICDSENGEISVKDVERLTNDMYKTVTPPGNEIIHVMPQDYSVDHQHGIKDPVGSPGVKLESDFHVITAHTSAISNINKCIKRSQNTDGNGLNIVNLVLEPLASSQSVLSEEEKEAGVVLVDIGGGTTDVAIFYDGIIRHTAVIPFGGNIITSDISEGCRVMQKQAEQLKMKFGKAIAEEANANDIVSIQGLRNRPPKEISIKNLAFIIESRMQEIIELVHTEIICSGYEDKLAGGIVITGGGSQLQGVKQLFEYNTGMDARIGYPNEHLGKGKFDEAKSPIFATGVGLVLAGFRALDERENRYAEFKEPVAGNKVFKRDNNKHFFKSILDRTKGLLLDDIDDRPDSNY